jgi:EAL domain-containing protein (putative c-di-GMP-specific phosphodiesterase class I)/AmiR/NasT family two-component response regulator
MNSEKPKDMTSVLAGSEAGTATSSNDAASVAPPAADLHVLIVEDHDFQRRALGHLMRSLGAAEVYEAKDGIDALKKLRQQANDIDLILCDLDMPNMDGMEFIRHFGQLDCPAAVIISSAHDSNVINSVQIMAQAYGVRLLGVIEKPATIAVISQLLATANQELPLSQTQVFAALPGFSLEEIKEGIEAGQFEPFFQPKADIHTGRIVGAEALARWRHPERGIVGPYAFIDTLERSGNLDALTFLMLRRAALAVRGWQKHDLDLCVSVNLSLTSLEDTALADRITRTVAGVDVDPSRIILEITESAAMTEVAPALENLARLRLRGFGLSIDDFGTGFSSMQQLGRIAFTELKIDRSFVSRMTDNKEARAIVESSIDMARRLKISSVAEGVESQNEWNALKAAGCKLAQGYFIARPVEDEEFIALCQRAAS